MACFTVRSLPSRWLALLSLVGCAAAGAPAGAPLPPPAMDQRVPLEGWVSVESKHVSIVSAAGEQRTLELAAQLERLIAVLGAIGTAHRFDSRVPATIYLFPDSSAYSFFDPGNTLGHFYESERGFFILMGPDYETRAVLFHEYVHLLMRNQGSFEYPMWYEEGLAELIGPTTFREHLISLGGSPGLRTATLHGGSLLSLDQIVGAGSYDDVSKAMPQFYAQSWLLTHLLHLGHHVGYPRRIDQLRAYLLALQTVPDWRVAFDASFPDGFDALAADLESYRQRVVKDAYLPRIRIDARKLADVELAATSHPIEPVAIGVALGSVYLDQGASSARYAQRLFERALEKEPAHARAHAGLARAHAFLGAFDDAEAELARAEAAAPEDAFVLRARGAVLLLEAPKPSNKVAAREALRRAVALEPAVPEGYALLGQSFLGDARNSGEGIAALEHAHAMLPWNEAINLDLARLYAQAGQTDLAIAHVDRVLRWSHGRSLEQARALREEIERDAATSGAQGRAGGS